VYALVFGVLLKGDNYFPGNIKKNIKKPEGMSLPVCYIKVIKQLN